MEKNKKSLEVLLSEYAELEKRRYRREMKIKNLEHNVTRCDPDDFDGLMHELEEAREQDESLALEIFKVRSAIYKAEYPM